MSNELNLESNLKSNDNDTVATNDDFGDELLNDLKALDEATDDMEESVKIAKESEQKLANTDAPKTIDSVTIALQSAEISQSSAENSQRAVEAAIKLSHEQKQQAMELSDLTLGWRNTVNKAHKAIESQKKAVSIMLVVSLVLSSVAVGAVGFLYSSLNKKNELLKGDVLDIISTELSLSSKKYQTKQDQLGSLIESINIPQMAPVVKKETIQQNTTPDKAPVTKVIETKVVKFDDSKINQQLVEFNQQQQKQIVKIEALLAKINQNQKNLTQSQTSPQMVSPIKVTAMGLTESQLKKLNSISWAIDKQSKILQAIQKKVSAQNNKPKKIDIDQKTPNNTKKLETLLKDLKEQINQIQNQQRATQDQVQSLKTKTKKPAGIPREYRYKSRD
jgi:hypothetical protein